MNKIRWKDECVTLSERQIYLANMRFEETDEWKTRPVVVVKSRGDTCSVMEITSRPASYESDVKILDLMCTGLNRESVIQTKKRRRIYKSSLRTYLGVLSHHDMRRVENVARLCQ